MARVNEGAALINSGLMTAADATAAGKGNRARTDINGAGFSTQMKAFGAAAASMKSGGQGMTTQQAQGYLDTTLQESEPGDLLAGNTRTVQAMAPAMRRNLQNAIADRDAAGARGDADAYAEHDVRVNRALGQIAGVQDNLNRTSPQKAAMFADGENGVNSMMVARQDGSQVTVRQLVNEASTAPPDSRGVQEFLAVRKEYGNARAAAQAGAFTPPAPEEGH
jgi:hypothetical protein